MKIEIRKGMVDETLAIQNQIPEFKDSYPKSEYLKRLTRTKHLVLIASLNNEVIGFKVGYALDNTIFYSWMGGVLPDYRKMQVAKQLAQYQEKWARQNDFQVIRFKTRNYLKPMLIFGLKNGFHITDVIEKEDPAQHRIILEKRL